ncbi:phosphate-selective porin OprO and OprP [Bradyrhizobium sp. Rc2d]|uniref:OprO/OprP family phosphate-selective porin n=1 Tax=Bradyrhizobium sp. Rc2d TaxID=1855321 RepID=UPI0008814578|nr:OprO/OprP family phosphate-selective porin [Bradyrhizobium sp. Rc2d]SDJ63688.1 phosphate-selective porin OprO and OprP [Bradyrhizobium sp. Rc2d]
MIRTTLAAGVGLAAALAAPQAQAQSASNSEEIALLKQQLHLLERKLDRLQKQTTANTQAAAKANAKADATKTAAANANAALPVKGAPVASGVVVTMPNNRPTICTADEQNCVSLTSRVHFDAGGYDYHPNTAGTVPQRLDDGTNLRRARIGVLGKFFGDWNYVLIYDFGGSSDGFGGTAPGSLPGGGVSGVENAYLSYTGLKPFGGKMAIEGGIMDIPYTLDEATSSNDILFMERASAGVIATNIAAGDFRSTFGTRWWNDVFWAGAYVTGPTTGAIHSASSITPPGTTEQYGAVARAAGQIVSGKDYSLHLGADAEWLIQPPHNLVTGAQTVTLSDRPELRIDPTALISTGAIANASGAQVYSIETAATYGPLWLQGEYYWFNVDRGAATGLPPFGAPSLKFQGGYAQASYVLTGETHTYNPAAAAYNGINPTNPFSLAGGGWGAWEIAGRVSTIDLNDQLATATGIAGGRQTIYTAGLNWYVNRNVRFMLNYVHGNISKQAAPTGAADVGSKFDAIAMRTQVAF